MGQECNTIVEHDVLIYVFGESALLEIQKSEMEGTYMKCTNQSCGQKIVKTKQFVRKQMC